MKRKLVLIVDHGEDGKLKGVDIDKNNYLAFFKSDEGGAWEDNEISIYSDNFNLSAFKAVNRVWALRNQGYDYFLIVFCGHGEETINHTLKYELHPGIYSSLNEIQDAVGNSRCLFIADSCRYIERMQEGGRLICFSAVTESASYHEKSYRQRCKDLYNELVMAMPEGFFVAGLAASSDEFANESSTIGGFYSHSLIESACEMRDQLRSAHKQGKEIRISAYSFTDVHEVAYSKVVAMNNKQHPELLAPRRKITFPMVVVPRPLTERIIDLRRR